MAYLLMILNVTTHMVCLILSVSYFISKLKPINLDIDRIYKLLYTKTSTTYANSFIIKYCVQIHQITLGLFKAYQLL
jgi:hypothetical protein